MAFFLKKMSKTAGRMPGELVHIGEESDRPVEITVIDYDQKDFQESTLKDIAQCFTYKETDSVTWININGIHDVSIVEKVGSAFDLHSLVLEDIVNTGQRPKLENAERYIHIVLKMLMVDKDSEIISEQVSLILGPNYVISFQERAGDVFEFVRTRIRSNKGRVRKSGADYLAYCLIDAIVDNYYAILENFSDKIEGMQEVLVSNPTPKTLQSIHTLKRDVIHLRKSIWPLREVAAGLERNESALIKKSTRIFLRDVYDHTIQVIDTIETFRDMVSGMVDIYLSSISNRMNEVMKVLTIIATIFIPLTFIAGIYGMNFDPSVSPYNMPELSWRYGYFFSLGLMVLAAAGMVVYFKRKKWL
jgi:magnesium transporter